MQLLHKIIILKLISGSNWKKEPRFCPDCGKPPVHARKQRPMCKYGADCYRRNPDHARNKQHPAGWKPPSAAAASSADARPECRYGSACYRKNPEHAREFQHPAGWRPAQPVAKCRYGAACYDKSEKHLRKYSHSDTVLLYHETDEAAARSILASQIFKCGRKGIVGPGIYFALKAEDTGHKAEHHGKILRARVRLGKVFIIEHGQERGWNAEKVRAQGYDSVQINRRGGVEFCVYDPERITKVEQHT
jgi:hypothetical protein